MKISRRSFLLAGGAATAAALAPGRLVRALESQAPKPVDVSSWAAIRALFPLTPGYLHFSSFYLVSHPRPVQDAIDGFRRALDGNPLLTIDHGMFESETDNLQHKVRESAAGYLGGKPEEVALTANTTAGLAIVYNGLTLAPGDEVLLTTHDHYVHHETVRLLAARTGARTRRVALYDRPADTSVDEVTRRVREALKPETRVLGVTWVHSSTGVRLPIRAIADVVREANRNRDEKHRILLVVDGVHGFGCVDGNVADLGADFFCAGTHKWIFAPRGTGIVWARAENWARVRPTIPPVSFDSFEAWMADQPPAEPNNAGRMSPGGFIAFEHQWAMGEAFRFHERIGRKRIADRIRELNDQCKAGLAGMRGITLHTPRDPALSAGIVCFEVAGKKTDDVVKALHERKVVASASPYRTSYVRLAPSLVNDAGEVETALREVRTLAGA
jgi:selenocysteine lyase/cysteine desulfurase